MSGNVHIVPRGEDWAVQIGGNDRATSIHPTQQEAVEAGRERARRDQAELIIHGRDGRIRDRDSYGEDPYPPKG